MDVNELCVKFEHPFTCIIAGPTSCGKTKFVTKLLTDDIIVKKPDHILYCYSQYQPLYDEMKTAVTNIEFYLGIPATLETDYLHRPERKLLILDDVMQQAGADPMITRLFIQGSHHRNLSVICLLQNLFYQGPQMRTISLNTHYIVLFKNARDKQQVKTLARQMYPNNTKSLEEAYTDATKRSYGYLVLNLKPATDELCRMVSRIFTDEQPAVVYVPSKCI